MNIVNIAAYRFVTLEPSNLPALRDALKTKADACDLKGTVLLSAEGINLFLAGTDAHIREFQQYLDTYAAFKDLAYKKSDSDEQPFSRMLVRIKKEIIPMGRPEVQPAHKTAPHLSPEEFKRWYEEQKDMIVLDTRNDFEVALGTFEDAIDLNLEHFREFPDMVRLLPEAVKNKPVVTFCTGGIRCEKAAEYMLQNGFKEVYQLEGGILNYFERCKGAYYQGECFVFDKRVALDADLQETETQQCYDCRAVVSARQEKALCPLCGSSQLG